MADLPITLRGESLLLLPERAVYWPARRALIVADVHFGKAATFRAGGIAIPGGTTAAMLRRLDGALARTGATRLLALGDLLHARGGRTPHMLDTVAAWRATRPDLRLTLVRGNHDRRAGDPPAEWGVECLDAPVIEEPFAWFHEPPGTETGSPLGAAASRAATWVFGFTPAESPPGQVAPEVYPVAGHVHPAVALNGGGRSLTVPCFYFGRAYGLLPAFGEFTGTAVVRPRVGEGVYVVAGEEIVDRSSR